MRQDQGAVLPLVLLAMLVIAAASFAMSFKVTLDVMAARSALSAAQAHAQAAGGLALAVAEHQSALLAGNEPPTGHGPWPQHGVLATVTVAPAGAVSLPGTDEPAESVPAVTLIATATVGRATATTRVTLIFAPALSVLARR